MPQNRIFVAPHVHFCRAVVSFRALLQTLRLHWFIAEAAQNVICATPKAHFCGAEASFRTIAARHCDGIAALIAEAPQNLIFVPPRLNFAGL